MTKRRTKAGETVAGPVADSGLGELEAVVGHRFKRRELLELALTHRSYVYDSGAERAGVSAELEDPAGLAHPGRDNEQFEFLGDAVLGLVVAESLCERFPASREGELTRMRAAVVSRRHLGEVGKRLEIGRWLRVGKTLEENDGRGSAAVVSNAVEAVVAAIYLDGGLAAAREFSERWVLEEAMPRLAESVGRGEKFSGAVGDHKSALQELMQATGMGAPVYRLVEETGPAHRLRFRVEVLGGGEERLAEAEASSKKRAQQEAAKLAFARLQELGAGTDQ